MIEEHSIVINSLELKLQMIEEHCSNMLRYTESIQNTVHSNELFTQSCYVPELANPD